MGICFWLTINRHEHSEKRRGVMNEFDVVGYLAVAGGFGTEGLSEFYNFSSSSSCSVEPNFVICLLRSGVDHLKQTSIAELTFFPKLLLVFRVQRYVA